MGFENPSILDRRRAASNRREIKTEMQSNCVTGVAFDRHLLHVISGIRRSNRRYRPFHESKVSLARANARRLVLFIGARGRPLFRTVQDFSKTGSLSLGIGHEPPRDHVTFFCVCPISRFLFCVKCRALRRMSSPSKVYFPVPGFAFERL
jgi:hypothetical protein